jgi:iron complex transport system ATP-binding protein
VRLILQDVCARYGERTALESINAAISSPSLIGVVGPNGAGKSTLLKAIAGLTDRTGSISIDSLCLDDAPSAVVARNVAYCSQSLFPAWPICVREVVALGRLPHKDDREARLQDESATANAIERMALTDFADRPIDTLSGGERARAMLARTLATRANVVLLDEPTSDLDPYHEIRTMEILREEAERGVIVVVVVHDLTLAARFCDHIFVLESGRIRASRTPETVFDRALLASVYAIEAVIGSHDGSALVIPWRRIE